VDTYFHIMYKILLTPGLTGFSKCWFHMKTDTDYLQIAMKIWSFFKQVGDTFFSRVVTGEEIMVQHWGPGMKEDTMQ